MKISFYNGVFVASASYEERAMPKAAGFWWHGGGCRPGCKACAAGLGKVWWTHFPEKAATLRDYCDDSATKALAPTLEALEGSRATDADIDIPAPKGLAYLPYQRGGIAYALKRKSTLIGDDMGLGKTIQALGVVNADKSLINVLVICPASLKINWMREAEKWLVTPRKAQVLKKSNDKVDPEAQLVIVNYELLKNDVQKRLLERTWDCIISDESHLLKNAKAQRTRAVFGAKKTKALPAKPGLVSQLTPNGKLLLLTGTPIMNRPMEMFSLLNALDPTTWPNAFSFGRRYCNGQQKHIGGGRYVWDFGGASHLEELQQRLRANLLVRRMKSEVLKELPPKRRQVLPVDANGGSKWVERENLAWEEYQSMMDGLQAAKDLAEVSAKEEKEKYAAQVAKLQGALAPMFGEMALVRKEVALSKVPKVVEIVENALEGSEKVILFAHHHEVLDALYEAFKDKAAALDGRTSQAARQAAVDTFQDNPACRVFVGGIKAAGVGLTLTAANTVVFAELDWVPGNVTQAEDRAHRIGQHKSVNIIHVVVDGSLDSRLARALVAKQEVADNALDNEPDLTYLLSMADQATKDKEAREAKEKEWAEKAATEAPLVSDEEKRFLADALQIVAGMCDGARRLDGSGFNRYDSQVGKELAQRGAGRLYTNKEARLARRLATKYRGQLPSDLRGALRLG